MRTYRVIRRKKSECIFSKQAGSSLQLSVPICFKYFLDKEVRVLLKSVRELE